MGCQGTWGKFVRNSMSTLLFQTDFFSFSFHGLLCRLVRGCHKHNISGFNELSYDIFKNQRNMSPETVWLGRFIARWTIRLSASWLMAQWKAILWRTMLEYPSGTLHYWSYTHQNSILETCLYHLKALNIILLK